MPTLIQNTELHTWFERDRKCVELRNIATQNIIIEFTDEGVDEAVEDGFLTIPPFIRLLNKSKLHLEMYNLAIERGML